MEGLERLGLEIIHVLCQVKRFRVILYSIIVKAGIN